jgi:hypothetical protein
MQSLKLKKTNAKATPELIKEWIEKGNVILDEKYRETWANGLPIRLSYLYKGMELEWCLDIVLELNGFGLCVRQGLEAQKIN